MAEIINRVNQSSLKSIDLADFLVEGDRVLFDIKPYLFQELILKEKEFRKALRGLEWSQYKDKHVYLNCTTDAIVPTWAYMLVITYLNEVALTIVQGELKDLERTLLQNKIDQLERKDFENAKVVVKGCSELYDPVFAFSALTIKIQPWVSSLMYGEPCSTVPVFKKKKSM